ncbi:hypothetical protein DFS33DRAFT_1382327 [Desarmillaria ectypa]|nr:hypothetical protein DFS33DRAFT_1382327 [Desarmillaria ectypa]
MSLDYARIPESLSRTVHRYIGSLGGLSVRETMEASTDVPEKLMEGGVDLGSIKVETTGDMSEFPRTTELVVGPGSDLRTYPSDPNATLIESDLGGRKVTELSFSKEPLRIAYLTALDYFGDGSFYSLDTPGVVY